MDGTNMNVGYFLTGTGGYPANCNQYGTDSACGTNYQPVQYDAQNANSPNAPNSFNFVRNAASLQITLLGAFSSASTNPTAGNFLTQLGYYDASAANQAAALGTLQAIYDPAFNTNYSTQLGQSAALAPAYTNYGIYATVCTAGSQVGAQFVCSSRNTYFSNSAFNTADGTHQHFALFTLAGSGNQQNFAIGFEDGLANNPTEGIGDYNDIIVRISGTLPVVAPEPATYGLMGVSLLGLGIARLRKRA